MCAPRPPNQPFDTFAIVSIDMNAQPKFAPRSPPTIVLVAALLGACSHAQPPTEPAPAQVSVVTVHKTSVPVTFELPGRTSAFFVAQVRARVDGIVLKRDYR